jgi:hypothetical protein
MDCNIDRRIAADARQGRETSEASIGFVGKTCGCRRCRVRREAARLAALPGMTALERRAVEAFLRDDRRPMEVE